MRALNVLLALLVSLLIGLGVMELGLRLIPAFAPPATLNRFDPQTGWSKVPGKSITRRVGSQKIHFSINENGLRDDPGVGPGKPAGVYRVLALGDSFVLGYTVERRDLFVDLLERWWNGEERRVDVVNTGTEGWSTDQEVAWFLHNAQAYQPDLVLLFAYENDLWWNGQPAYQTGVPKPLFSPQGELEERQLVEPPHAGWLASTALARFARITGARLRAALGQRGPMNPEFNVLFDPPLPGTEAPVADCIARTRGALKALRDGSKILGARLVLVPIPSKSAIDPEERAFFQSWDQGLQGTSAPWSPDRPVNLFLDLARELGIEALDPREALVAANKEHPLYFPRETEWHFNAQGNRAFARWLHDEFDRRAILPADHSALARAELPEAEAGAGGVPTFVYVYLALWLVLGLSFCATYPKEPALRSFLSVGGLLFLVFTIVIGGGKLAALIDPRWAPWIVGTFVLGILGFVAWKLGRRLGTIGELLRAFTLRGHWYLMPLVVILLTIGSLLVVAASSPLIAPFIYTLF